MQNFFDDLYNNAHHYFNGVDNFHPEQQYFFIRQLSNAFNAYQKSALKMFNVGDDEAYNVLAESYLSRVGYFMDDLRNSATFLNVQLTPHDSFTIGKDVATTAGEVIFSNELFELIQYKPIHNEVHSTPILFIPSVINKYYILDLTPQKSIVRWLLEKKHTVFMISWRNPDQDMDKCNVSDYVLNGVVKALSVITKIVRKRAIHTVGYCLGGTLLALAASYYKKKNITSKIKTTSFLATLLDFSSPGDLFFFIKTPICQFLLSNANDRKYFDGRDLNVIFNLLRENTLYWNYYLNRYFSDTPSAISDFLFWSGDGMNLHIEFLRDISNDFYLSNKFTSKEGIKIGDVYVNIENLNTPSYFVATQSDHITPWRGCFMSAKKITAPCQFILGKSGHVAGIINPPNQNKYGFWINPLASADQDEWLENAQYCSGSWWEHWYSWLSEHQKGTNLIPPPVLGNKDFPAGGNAPGLYVLGKC